MVIYSCFIKSVLHLVSIYFDMLIVNIGASSLRSAQASFTHYRLECLCQCQTSGCWGFCSIYLVEFTYRFPTTSFSLKSWILLSYDNNAPLIYLGMRKISSFWAFVVPLDLKLWCHHLFFQVTVCTLDYLLPQLMLLQLIVASLFSITPGGNTLFSCFLCFSVRAPSDKTLCHQG